MVLLRYGLARECTTNKQGIGTFSCLDPHPMHSIRDSTTQHSQVRGSGTLRNYSRTEVGWEEGGVQKHPE
ncbi:hypothetical protein BS47DRAFT_1353404 [Hydnum rufescens UP504]|uniref:Uncharacterized protein n=1 Tax=Hydnum rufescens UP504 TaxID=1448309 RepID=A0A9P6AII6_9AGAM|nr:hypothetical protein BS47DRAFT_1353404 [Hydnum rufescens UP504]